MKVLFRWISVALLCFPGFRLSAGIYPERFAMFHIGYEEGISNERVFSVVEDRNNVIWIATKSGIDRYNGREIRAYGLSGDYYSGDFAGRRLKLLYSGSVLWAYDNIGGIYRYSEGRDLFELVFSLKDYIGGEIILNDMCIDGEGTFWFGLGKGFYRMDAGGAISCEIKDVYVNAIVGASRGLYVGVSEGVIHYYDETAEYILRPIETQSLFYDEVSGILWAGSFDEGLWKIDTVTGTSWRVCQGNPVFLNPIRAIDSYDGETVLVGIDGGGVYAVEKDTGRENLLFNTEDSSDIFLRGNGVYDVTADSQGNVWVGSYTGGVSSAILLRYPINVFAHERGNEGSLSDSNVNGVAENSDGKLWFATDRGISIRDNDDKSWTHLLKNCVVVTLCRGKGGTMWAGTYGKGLYQLSAGGDVMQHFTKQDGSLTTNYIFALTVDAGNNLWVGGHEGNLLKLGPDGKRQMTVDIKWVHALSHENDSTMAVATVNGFCLVDTASGEVSRYATYEKNSDKDASAYIVSLLSNGDGTYWLGTEGGGAMLYDVKKGFLRSVNSGCGLPSDDVYGLVRDFKGRIWTSTDKGLAVIDDFRVYNLNYMAEVEHDYNKSSCAMLSDGSMIFGSTDGAVRVWPDMVSSSDYEAPLRIVGVDIWNVGQEEAKTFRPEVHEMLEAGNVILPYFRNSFSVSFESINYRFGRDILYEHFLEGYEKSWNGPAPEGNVRYTNVSPGNYVLKVRSVRRSNGQVISECSLPIKVRRPWWNTWYSWIFYSMLVSGFFILMYGFKKSRLQKKYDEDKIRFFIDTAHDIRTPATLISAPLEDLDREKSLSENARYYLGLAMDGTRRLNALISQLLEFERIDAGYGNVHLRPENVSLLLQHECDAFQAYCDRKQLSLDVEMPCGDIYAFADRKMLEMVLDNLLSNACKYTSSGGHIALRLRRDRCKVYIEVADNGIGIPSKDRKRIFAEVYRADNAKKLQGDGIGFGLLQVSRIVKMLKGKITCASEENKGSVFTLTLKSAGAAPEETGTEGNLVETASVRKTDDMVPEKSESVKYGGTLLVVEDHEALRSYLGRTFGQEYNVVLVADGESAMEYLAESYPDIILSDLMLPGIQGDDLCRMVKENQDTAGIPFILLTARTDKASQAEGLQKGADDYISKPFDINILKLKLKGMLENRKRLRETYMRSAIDRTGGSMASENSADSAFVTKATGIVFDHISDSGFGIDELCHEMAMSRTLFYSRLKSLTGKGPQEFIRTIRLHKAAELLKEGESVADVTVDTGFVNVKYFSVIFKKEFGVSPGHYAK